MFVLSVPAIVPLSLGVSFIVFIGAVTFLQLCIWVSEKTVPVENPVYFPTAELYRRRPVLLRTEETADKVYQRSKNLSKEQNIFFFGRQFEDDMKNNDPDVIPRLRRYIQDVIEKKQQVEELAQLTASKNIELFDLNKKLTFELEELKRFG